MPSKKTLGLLPFRSVRGDLKAGLLELENLSRR